MTTLANDIVRLHLTIGTQNIPLIALGLDWPPPERITELKGVPFDPPLVRTNLSNLTDEQADNPHLARGAEYYYEDQVPT